MTDLHAQQRRLRKAAREVHESLRSLRDLYLSLGAHPQSASVMDIEQAARLIERVERIG